MRGVGRCSSALLATDLIYPIPNLGRGLHSVQPRMASTSIPAWLDAVKAGYGDKYSACFDDLGIDDVADISENLGKAAMLAALEEGLCKAGAKMVHIANIKSAIAKVAMPHRPEAPVSSKQASPNKQHSGRTLQGGGDCAMIEWTKRDSGKRFACFLSHHKASCAMEARFLKDKLSDLIQKECFLDSDNLRNLRELLDSVLVIATATCS